MTIGILITVLGTAILTGIPITVMEDIGHGVIIHGCITVWDITDGDITDGEIQIIMKTLTKVDLILTEIIKMYHTVKVEEEVQVVL
jgi:hypothetical protein